MNQDTIKKWFLIAIVAFIAWKIASDSGIIDNVNIGGKAPPYVSTERTALIVESTEGRGSYTPGQRAAILGSAEGSVKKLINGMGDGKFLSLDLENPPGTNAPDWAGKAYLVWKTTANGQHPWIVGAGPKSGINQKLPEKIEETVTLLGGIK